VGELFSYWMEHPSELPASYQQQMQSDSRARVVCDYIAGMTDNYILDRHRRVRGRTMAR